MWDSFVIEKNDKYLRLNLPKMSLNELILLFADKNFSCFFLVFKHDNHFERFKISPPKSQEELILFFNTKLLNTIEHGIDSDNFNILEAEYIDCYPI